MEGERIEALVGELLRARSWTICAAESCTGGLVMHRLTNIPGSSDYVVGGVVAYSNQVKQSLLHVHPGTLIAHGAVSEETAREMAVGARDLLNADVAVSVTGIAGPGGGTQEKPVGLTYMALAAPNDVLIVQRHVWKGDREAIKSASAQSALLLVFDYLSKNDTDK
jgi:nicotinamide-nucleotide amidase